MVQWTLGELAVSNYETSAASLLEGFHHGPSADLSTAISDLVLDEEVLLSPVPASHFLNLSTTYRGELTYRMFDVIGHQRLVDNFEGQVRIDLSRLVPGVYWVELVTSEGRRGYYSFVKT